MKNGVVLPLTLVFAISGFALIFCRKEDPAGSSLRAAKVKAAGAARFEAGTVPDGKPAGAKAKPKAKTPAPAALTPEQEAEELARLQRIVLARSEYDAALAANDAVAISSRDFLAANGQQDYVTTTASGLQYETVITGLGPAPAATDTVNVHYHGTLPDGTVFDSSTERGQPLSFPLQGVIAGWTEGVQLMPAGSKFKFFIPSCLAYGGQGVPPKIPGRTSCQVPERAVHDKRWSADRSLRMPRSNPMTGAAEDHPYSGA